MNKKLSNKEAPRRGRRRRPRRRKNKPLRVSFADRLAPLMPKLSGAPPPPKPRPLPAPPPKSARSILGLLMASTGLALAARRVHVELLPGTPTTVVVCEQGKARAAFVLPMSHDEARKHFGRPAREPRNRLVEQLFEEERQADLAGPDMELQYAESYVWGMEDADAGFC